MKTTLTVVILTRLANSALSRHLNILGIADEIIIVSDQEPEKFTSPKKVKIFHHPLGNNFASQRNFALSKVETDWVLFIDDDEFLSKSLISEIRNALNSKDVVGFRLRRIDSFYNQPLRFGESGKTLLLRLAKANSGSWKRSVHETWQVKGRITDLLNPIDHKRKDLTSGFIQRMAFYSPIDSRSLNQEGKKFSYYRLMFYPLGKFIRNYFLFFGFLDGLLGLFHAYLMMIQSFTVRIYQWENS